MLRLVVTFEF